MIRIIFYFFLIIIILTSALFLTPLSLLVSLTNLNEDISFSDSKGNLFSGEIDNLKINNLNIQQLIYDNNFLTDKINSNISFIGILTGNSEISYVYGSDHLLVEKVSAILKFNNEIIGNVQLSFNNSSQIKIKNRTCTNGSATGELSSSLVNNTVDIYLECVKGAIDIFSAKGNFKERIGTIKMSETNFTLEIAPQTLIDGLPFYLNKKIKLDLIR